MNYAQIEVRSDRDITELIRSIRLPKMGVDAYFDGREYVYEISSWTEYYDIGYPKGDWYSLSRVLMILVSSQFVTKILYGNVACMKNMDIERFMKIMNHYVTTSNSVNPICAPQEEVIICIDSKGKRSLVEDGDEFDTVEKWDQKFPNDCPHRFYKYGLL